MHQLEFFQAVAKKEEGRSSETGLSPPRQLVEHGIRNAGVISSSLTGGTTLPLFPGMFYD